MLCLVNQTNLGMQKKALKDMFRNSRKIDSSFYNEAMLDRSKHFQNVHIDNSTSVTNAISLMGDE